MEIKCAVGNFDADFSRLNVTDLEIKLDVGNYKLTLPAATTDGRVKINAALSNTQVIVPDRAAARIRVQSSLCAVDIDQSRFTKQGDYYISSGYDSARNRLDIELDCDLGRVEIR
jgi:predicted membrane protein